MTPSSCNMGWIPQTFQHIVMDVKQDSQSVTTLTVKRVVSSRCVTMSSVTG